MSAFISVTFLNTNPLYFKNSAMLFELETEYLMTPSSGISSAYPEKTKDCCEDRAPSYNV